MQNLRLTAEENLGDTVALRIILLSTHLLDHRCNSGAKDALAVVVVINFERPASSARAIFSPRAATRTLLSKHSRPAASASKHAAFLLAFLWDFTCWETTDCV